MASKLKRNKQGQGKRHKRPYKISVRKNPIELNKGNHSFKFKFSNKGSSLQPKARNKPNIKNKPALAESHLPPLSVAKNASKGLKLREKFNRGGTNIGAIRAQQLKSKRPISLDIVKRMYSYFSRHKVDKRAKNFGDKTNPSAGYIAWLLWGGEEGFAWAKKVLKKQ